jgi:DNA-binding response OmpR family regulator
MKSTIVIADRDIVLLELLRNRCVAMGLSVVTASRGDDALVAIERLRPQLVCVDLFMECRAGLTVCEALARDAELARIPAIVLGDKQDERAERACRDLFAYIVPRVGNLWHRIEPLIYELTEFASLEPVPTGRPMGTTESVPYADARPELQDADERESVLEKVFALFDDGEDAIGRTASSATLRGPHRRESDEPPWVICIEDDEDFSMALKLRLEAHGVAVVRAFDGTAGYRAAFTHPASAILLDYNLPDGQGDYVLRRLKENPVTAEIPVIVLTGNSSTAVRRQMFNLGADAYLTKPLDFADLMDVLEPYVDMLPVAYAAV